MAEEVYDELATRSNLFHATNPRREFVNKCAPTLHAEARQVLAGMLGMDSVSAYDKEQIMEALMLDKILPNIGAWSLDDL